MKELCEKIWKIEISFNRFKIISYTQKTSDDTMKESYNKTPMPTFIFNLLMLIKLDVKHKYKKNMKIKNLNINTALI